MQIRTSNSRTFESTFQPMLSALCTITQQLGRGAMATDAADDLPAMILRRVLRTLLPELGTDIKGGMRFDTSR